MTTRNTFNMTKLPDDLSKKILKSMTLLPSLSSQTLKSLANSHKMAKEEITNHLTIVNHKNIKKFVKYQNIGNVLLVIQRSMFSLEDLIDILDYVENNDEINKNAFQELFPEVQQRPSSDCLNNTFIVYQIIKHTFIMSNKSQEVLDEILVDFFEEVYMFRTTSLKSFNKNFISLSDFTVSDVGTWHLIGFNLYYVYQMYRMYQDNYNINMNQYKQIQKYIFSYDTNVLKSSIQYIAEQYYYFAQTKEFFIDYKIYTYILSFILFKLYKDENTNDSDIIKIRHEEGYDIYKERININTVIERFEEYLNKIGDDTAIKILNTLQTKSS